MYTAYKHAGSSRVIARELPTFAGSLLIAETFYKFHSFSLECLAFLATWTALSWVSWMLLGPVRPTATTDA
jgi:hypothetical protein